MDIQHLHSFIALTEELNFTRAAARSHLSQPALSRRIRELERELGRELFDRDSHSVTLTPAGERFQRCAARLLEVFDEGRAAVRGEARVAADHLRVGLFQPAAAEQTGTVLAAFAARCPAARLRLVDLGSQDVEAALLEDRVDVAVAWGPVDPGRLAVRTLFTDQRAIAVAEHHPLADAGMLTVAELRAHRVTRIEHPNWHGFWSMMDGPAVGVRTFEESLLLALSGTAVSWVPRSLERFPRVVGLRYLPVLGADPVPVVVAHRRHEARALVTAFASVAERVTASTAAPAAARSGAGHG